MYSVPKNTTNTVSCKSQQTTQTGTLKMHDMKMWHKEKHGTPYVS